MHVVCMCMTVVKYNLLTAASVSVSAPEAASSILGHKRGCMLLVCVLHVATSVLDCLYSLLISSILVPDQWRSQDSKLGYSYFHVNKKISCF